MTQIDSMQQANVYFLHKLTNLGYSYESAEQRLKRTWRQLSVRNAMNPQEVVSAADRYASGR